jgi:hypothetical protein
MRCGCGSTVAVEHAAAMQAQRVGSRIDAGTTTIQEEGESGYFYFRADTMLPIGPFGRALRPINVRPDETKALSSTFSAFFCFCCILACEVK